MFNRPISAYKYYPQGKLEKGRGHEKRSGHNEGRWEKRVAKQMAVEDQTRSRYLLSPPHIYQEFQSNTPFTKNC